MTGPEHYQAGEVCLRGAEVAIGQYEDGYDSKKAIADTLTAQAQAHFTAALAAATAVLLPQAAESGFKDYEAWYRAAGHPLDGAP